MKKIYSKITKERQKQFQIETYITQDGDEKQVVKKALTPECIEHIQGMQRYYEKHRSANFLCPSRMISEKEVAFEFLQGKSLCNEMLEALAQRGEAKFISYLRIYDEIIRQNVQVVKGPFMAENGFEEIFGNVAFEDEIEYATGLNIDMAFDNIIRDESDGSYKIIDYEWVFPLNIPIKFVIYRAVLAFYTRNASAMKDIIGLGEIYGCFDITDSETIIFDHMNEAFNAYVYGGQDGYNSSVIAYKKEVYDVKKLLPEENLFLQVFLNDGTKYLEGRAITNHVIGKRVKMDIPLEFTQKVSEIRVDPLNVSCVLKNLQVKVVTKENDEYEVKEYQHNAIITKDNDFIFVSEDPQLIFQNCWENQLKMIKIRFTIKEAGLQDNPMLVALSEIKNQMNQMETQMRKVEGELEYIKGTKVYKTLLERKVDKVLGENE
ncbi:hypothetical protein DW654_07050 [Roseburia inulinivorans]|uniref:Uncharacterized protein n=1 Tax=Roseburia inulinivorans TaxID=360807 RepID=A0A414QWL2_9FIRM|nr:hypothetical protein [Roseburia inulinivorans]RHF85156.1 hypothetical protein DW654_07050 [Roseburia inulinivorans]